MAKSSKNEDLKDKIEDEIEELKDKYQEYKNSLVGYIRKKPMTALALAAGAGILIGTFWKAMRCRK